MYNNVHVIKVTLNYTVNYLIEDSTTWKVKRELKPVDFLSPILFSSVLRTTDFSRTGSKIIKRQKAFVNKFNI